ncbi:MAG: F0F1 ATP synthase subunit delta [Leptolyngbya sp. SIO1D8]|nr:F0F1 ATP synthase subunit delta [Leptolyngbya sp. SIO1D8]
MSSNTTALTIADPYAQALMSLAKDQQLVDRFGDDAQSVLEVLASSQDLQQFLANPLVVGESKKAVLQQLGGDSWHPLFVNFLRLLVDRGRVIFLEAVLKQYQKLLRQLKKTVLAEVKAAVELSETQKAQIRERVTAMTDAEQVELEVSLDPDLLGGVIIQVGSQIVDASLRGQLRRLGMQLNASA